MPKKSDKSVKDPDPSLMRRIDHLNNRVCELQKAYDQVSEVLRVARNKCDKAEHDLKSVNAELSAANRQNESLRKSGEHLVSVVRETRERLTAAEIERDNLSEALTRVVAVRGLPELKKYDYTPRPLGPAPMCVTRSEH